MKYENTLPENFDGVFRFTNWTDEDFAGRWNSKDYLFKAQTTSPIVIPEHSPLEIQHIRKKFAKDLAEREYFKSKKYGGMMNQERTAEGTPKLNSIHQAGTYNLNDLAPFIQQCLKPLETSRASVVDVPKQPLEDVLSRDESGGLNTTAIDRKASLRQKALDAA